MINVRKLLCRHLAHSEEEAFKLLKEENVWNIEELRRIEPRVISLDKPVVVNRLIAFG
jgi:hypothetical protein